MRFLIRLTTFLLMLPMLAGATFFQKNRQARSQAASTRRNGNKASGTIVIHTYEAPWTRSLLAAATWLLRRTTPGSYHTLVGAASRRNVMRLAPYSWETWHCRNTNNWSIGISMVAYASQWGKIPKSAEGNLIASAAYATADAIRWLERQGIKRSAILVRISRAQAMDRRPGLIAHGSTDPGRRTDPGANFPWTRFIAEVERELGTAAGSAGGTAPKPSKKSRVWPYTGLSDKAGRGTLDKAWVRLLGDVGYSQQGRNLRMQHWLRDRGYYRGYIDGKAGSYHVDALQRFLADRGFYKGAFDAFKVSPSKAWGAWLKQAEIDYLNDQRRYYPQ